MNPDKRRAGRAIRKRRRIIRQFTDAFTLMAKQAAVVSVAMNALGKAVGYEQGLARLAANREKTDD